ncbi:MAG: hypothetical protein P9X22_08235 [Candidatus Zapsychrus exili]|nr:hypothetical protein [Candidatus Zapsychrus exili]
MLHKIKKLLIISIIFTISINGPAFAQSVADEPELTIPTLKEQKAKEGYIINLKDLIKRSKKKIEHVNVKLKDQAKRRRNQQREEKAREYYEKAVRLSSEGKLELAQELWRKSIKITEHPEMKGYISESVRKTKSQQVAFDKEKIRKIRRLEIERGYSAEEVEKAYNIAVVLFKQKKYIEAQEDFEKVEDMFPDHKATRSYLMIIEQEINSEQQRLIDARLKEEALVRRKEKEEWKKELEKREKERQQYLKDQAESLYQDATKLYRAREFEKAKVKFKEIEWILPNYKATVHYLSGIDKDIEEESRRREIERKRSLENQIEEEISARKQREEKQRKLREQEEKDKIKRLKDEAEFVYKMGISLYKKKKFIESKAKFAEVKDIFSNYKSTDWYLSRIDDDIASEERQRIEKQRIEFELEIKRERIAQREAEKRQRKQYELEAKQELESLKAESELVYNIGVSLYKNRLYDQAKDKFLELKELYPSYKSTESYLKKIEVQIIKEKARLSRLEVNHKRTLKEEMSNELREEDLVLRRELENQKLIEKDKKQILKDEAELLYNTAVLFYKNKLFVQARDKFDELQRIYFNYKASSKYIDRINRKLNYDKKKESEISRKSKKFVEAEVSEDNGVIRQAIEERERMLTREAEEMYGKALSLYKSKEYLEAKQKFIKLEAFYPGYKDTLKYLSTIDETLYQTKLSKGKKQEKTIKDNIVQELDVEKRVVKPKTQQIDENVIQTYNQAIACYKNKDYLEAKEKFIEVNFIVPEYKATKKYLSRVEKKIDRERIRAEKRSKKERQQEIKRKENDKKDLASNVFDGAVLLYNQGDLILAQEKFLEAEDIAPGYKPTEKYLKKIYQGINIKKEQLSIKEIEVFIDSETVIKEQKEEVKKVITAGVKKKYKKALSLYKKKNYLEAKDMFGEVQVLNPNYKDVAYYLGKVDLDIVKDAEAIRQKKEEERLNNSAERKYRQAVNLYKIKKYEKSKESFNEINTIIPGYKEKSVEKYLKKISRSIKLEVKKEIKAESKKEVKVEAGILEDKTIDEEALAIKKAEEIKAKEEERKEKELRQRQEVIVKIAENKYKSAVKLYENKNLDQAREKFIEIEDIKSDYKDTIAYLKRIDIDFEIRKEKDIKKETTRSLDETVKSAYNRAVDLYKKKEFLKAQEKFREIDSIAYSYKTTRKYLKNIDKKIKSQAKAQEKCLERCTDYCLGSCFADGKVHILSQKKANRKTKIFTTSSGYDLTDEAEDIYKQAIALYGKKSYEKAKAKFNEVGLLVSRYKNVDKYLKIVDKKIEIQHRRFIKQKEKQDRAKRRGYSEKEEKIKAILKDSRQDWEIELDEVIYKLNAKKKEINRVKGLEREAYLRDMKVQRLKIKQLKKKRHKVQVKRERDLRRRLKEEERQRRMEEKAQARLERKQQKELKDKLRAEERALIEKEKEEEKQRKLEEQRRVEERRLQLKEEARLEEERELLARKLEQKMREDEERQKRLEEEERILEEQEKNLKKRQAELQARIQEKRELALKEEKKREGEDKKRRAEEIKSQGIIEIPRVVKAHHKMKFEQADGKTIEDYEYLQYKKEAADKRLKKDFHSFKRGQRELEKQQRVDLEKQRREIKRAVARKDKDHKKRLRREVAALYKDAVELYRQERYKESRAKFISVEGMCPGYKSAAGYIKKIGKTDIGRVVEAQENKRKEDFRQKKQEQTDSLEAQEQELAKKLENEKKEKEINDLGFLGEAKFLYDEAIINYKNKDYLAARDKLIVVDDIQPNYKSTKTYFKRCEQKILEKEREELRNAKLIEQKKESERLDKIKNLYNLAVKDYKRSNYLKAKDKFLEIDRKSPRYKLVKSYIKKCDRKIAQRKKQKEAREKYKKKQEVDRPRHDGMDDAFESEYRKAMDFYNMEDYKNAKDKFDEIERISGGYKLSAKYIKLCEDTIGEQYTQEREGIIKRKGLSREGYRNKQEKLMEEKKKREDLKKDKKFKNTKIRTEKLYKKIILSYRKGKMGLAEKQTLEFDNILRNHDFSLAYMLSKNRSLEKEKTRAENKTIKEDLRKEKLAKKRVEFNERKKSKLEEKENRELRKMERDIRREEERLAKERKLKEEAAKNKKRKPKDEQLIDKKREERIAQKYLEAIKNQRKAIEEEKLNKLKEKSLSIEKRKNIETDNSKELNKIVEQRQAELIREREEVRKNFKKHIDNLYEVANKYYKSQAFQHAQKVLNEIESMSPNYKRTRSYIKIIEKEIETEKKIEIERIKEESLKKDRSKEAIIAESLDYIEVAN